VSVTIQFRRDTSANWTSTNPVLAQGELGLVTDTGQYKIGDGSTAWNSLTYSALTGTFSSIPLNAGADPSAPTSGLIMYAKEVGGRVLPKYVGPSGLDTIIQPFFGGNGIQMAAPGTSTALSYWGMGAFTAVGTVSHPVITALSLGGSIRRARVASAATANSASELRLTVAPCMRGNASNLGGFFVTFRFGVATAVATQRIAVGLFALTTAIATTAEPSSLVNGVWIGRDSTDTNLQLMYNDTSGAASKIDLGASFSPLNTSAVFELVLFCKKGGNEIFYRVMDYESGAMADGSVTTDLPVSTTPITPHFYMNNGGTASAVWLEIYRYYLECDY
jgi:hypothetical protein